MDYLKIYNDLINDAILNPKVDFYKEKHHIIPKCMGGTNKKDNIIKLTARQHYISHWLLYKIYKTSKLVNAWYCMSRISEGQEERRINSHLFGYCKKERSRLLSEKCSGSGNNFFGKKHTTHSKKKMSESQIGKDNRSCSQIEDWIKNVAKKPKTKEHKQKIGRKGLIMLQNIITYEIIRVPYEDSRCLMDEWVNPRKINPEKKSKCKYCDIITTNSNLSRWHNEKCKHRRFDENKEC